MEPIEIPNVSPSKAIDSLVWIANDANIMDRGGKKPDKTILSPVYVLVFIYGDKTKPFPVPVTYPFFFFKQLNDLQDQIIKIKHSILL